MVLFEAVEVENLNVVGVGPHQMLGAVLGNVAVAVQVRD